MAAYDWDASWTVTSIEADTITDTNSLTTAAISNDGKLMTEVSVEIIYPVSTTEGVVVYVLRDSEGTDEAVIDAPFSFVMPHTASTTHQKVFSVPPSYSSFKIHLVNDSGQTITADVNFKQAVV